VVNLKRKQAYKGLPLSKGNPLGLLLSPLASFVGVIVLCVGSFSIAHARITDTASYFRDDELSQNNLFQAGMLGFSVQSQGVGYTFEPNDPDSAFEVSVIMPGVGSLPAHYRVHSEQTGGSAALCQALHASATTSPLIFDGPLMSLATSTDVGLSQLSISLPSSSGLTDSSCNIDLVYDAWAGSDSGSGYTDERRVPLTFFFTIPPEKGSAPSATISGDSGTSTDVSTTTQNDATTTATSTAPDQSAGGSEGGSVLGASTTTDATNSTTTTADTTTIDVSTTSSADTSTSTSDQNSTQNSPPPPPDPAPSNPATSTASQP
jgi:hypothetical protein